MSLRIEPVRTAADLRRYLRVPLAVNDRPNCVPALRSDEAAFHDEARNPSLSACRAVRFLAWEGDRPVGRVMGIIRPDYNDREGVREGRFYQLDCRRDPDAVRLLLRAVEGWAAAEGMTHVLGPFGLSDKDPQGLQVEGFEHLPVLATASNPAWLPPLVEGNGYAKHLDAVSYRLDIPAALPEAYRRIADRVLAQGRYRLVRFERRSQIKPFILPVLRLVNAAYEGLLGFMPMTEAEMRKLAAQYMPVLDPAFVHVVVDEQGDPAAFVVAMPDFSEGIRRSGGRLFPFGWWHMLRAMRTSRQLDLFLGAVRPELQGRGLTSVLAIALMEEARKRGLRWIDSHLVLETNHRMRGELERLGATVWKRYRIYRKAL
ncbi:MAG: hypothetical protein QY325_00535 [Flavobacteriales bacterium]|jgi:GNAT superfamily N-acetyltransferase|nr:MAG: hypothetical protein QY325_00535 [Flavobacteriales bacterium]